MPQMIARRTHASKPRSRIYEIDGGYLFVPAEDMWNLHEASKPSAISARTKLGDKIWFQWLNKYPDKPWLADYLYGSGVWPSDAEFQPTPGMLAFREQATIRSILAAACRSEKRIRAAWRHHYLPQVGEALLSDWRRRYRPHKWFERWLLRGEEPPESGNRRHRSSCETLCSGMGLCKLLSANRPTNRYLSALAQPEADSQPWLVEMAIRWAGSGRGVCRRS
jgi:hypothetical protein